MIFFINIYITCVRQQITKHLNIWINVIFKCNKTNYKKKHQKQDWLIIIETNKNVIIYTYIVDQTQLVKYFDNIVFKFFRTIFFTHSFIFSVRV